VLAKDNAELVCSRCKADLAWQSQATVEGDDVIEGVLACTGCHATFPVRNGIARFVDGLAGYNAMWNYKWTEIDRGRGLNYRIIDPSDPAYDIHDIYDRNSHDGEAFKRMRGGRAIEIGCGVGQYVVKSLKEHAPERIFALDLTEGVDPPEPLPIAVPLGDLHFDPTASGSATIPFNRSIHDPRSGTDRANPREQLNEITGWIDASNVYGSDPERAAALRANDGTGRLATGPGGLLPDDDGTLPNATGGTGETLFVAGDVRANEQLGLIALHTLFVREHNRLADEIRRLDPTLDGDAIYERARRRVGALMQIITYEEFLPALLGRNAIAPYAGYDPEVDARIANEFSTAAFRFGHSALPPRLLRLDSRLREMPEGHVPLRDAFFHPDRIRFEGGIDPILRGLAHQRHQRIDVFVIDDVRNFLFGPPGAGGFDLVSLNIQRGRDHGLARYDDVRVAYGLPRVSRFDEISPDPAIRARLASVYREVDEIDLWVGGLAEDPVPGAHVGPLVRAILIEQFTALRDGDRFWYERALGRRELDRLRGTRLSDVIRRNTAIRGEIPDDVFRVAPRDRRRSSRRHRPASVRAPDRLEFELVMHDPDQD